MELPKNITQIGESDHYCKIYVEDYVISYIKQLNQHARDKELAVAMYGVRKEEAGITYLFFYGAGKVNFLQRECRHLSQAQLQEIEKIRKRYFAEYVFLGYRLLNGEMIEGFHVCEQGVCRYITGYAQFYEKNDSMLAFMLEERRETVKPEEVSQEKYEEVKKRQEERKAQIIPYQKGKKGTPEAGLRKMKLAAAGVFVLLCAAGLATLNSGEKMNELQVTARQMIEKMSEQQLPDELPATADNANVGVIVAEDKLTAAIQKENAAAECSVVEPQEKAAEQTKESTSETTFEALPETTPEVTQEPVDQQNPEETPEPTIQPTPEKTAEPASEPVSYTIKRGDTLIGICLKQYGSDAKISEICTLNEIADPDDIKVGQKILLP